MMLSKHDAYYEPPMSPDGVDWEDFGPERTAELMKTDFNPYKHCRFSEALSECSKEDKVIIEDLIERNEFEQLGRKLCDMAYQYCEHYAEEIAAIQYDRGDY